MDGGTIVFLAVSFVLIIAWTAYNIWNVRRSTRLWRELQKMIEEQKEAEGEKK
jgi:ABC-type nickel/cobalt efflux system permease component RcnA